MGEELSFLAKVICRYLGWHWPGLKHWHYNGQMHTSCRLCHRVISTINGDNKWH